MKRIYNNEVCSEVTKCYNEGIRASQISAKFDIPISSVYYILQNRRINKPTQKELIIVQQRFARQLLINQIRDEFDNSPFSRTGQKIGFIIDNLSEYSLSIMCEALHVSKSSYYLQTTPHKKTTYELRREELTPLITDLFYEHSVKESFFKTLKCEEIYRRIYRSEREMLESIEKFITYYNNERPHSYLGYKAPAEAERLYYGKTAK